MTRWTAPAVLASWAWLMSPDASCEGGGPPDGSTFAEYDALDYHYRFDVQTGNALATVTLLSLDGGNCIEIPFGLSEAQNLTLDGAPPDWSAIDAGMLQVCGADVGAGAERVLSLSTTVPKGTQNGTDVGFSATRDAQGATYYYLVSWVGGCSQFGPCDHRTDDFATYHFEITHPSDYRALCPGVVTSLTPTETSCVAEADGIPTYTGFGFMASKSWSAPVTLGTAGGVTVSMYDMPGVGAATQVDKTNYLGFLGWIQELLGAFPYGSALRFEIGPHYWWGFEHPGSVALSDSLVGATGSYQDPLLHVMMHETAHHWAGNKTTLADTYDFVWKEAMAEYLSFVYEAENLPAAYGTRTLRVWKSNALLVSYYPVPLEEPDLFDYYDDVYGPGPLVLFRQLEGLFGREAVLSALEEVLGGAPGFLSVDGLQQALERATGADLTTYFNEWVYGAGAPRWPVVGVRFEDPEGDGSYRIEVTQTQGTNVVYGFKSTLRLQGANANQVMDVPFSFGVNGDTSTVVVNATPGFAITSILVDPYDEALVTPQGAALPEEPELRFMPF